MNGLAVEPRPRIDADASSFEKDGESVGLGRREINLIWVVALMDLVGAFGQSSEVAEFQITYGGESTVMKFVTSYCRLIIPWCSRRRYIMTSPMTRMVTPIKD